MTVGKPDEITRENAADPLENARAFEADGLVRHDAFLLKQAAQAYRSGNDMAKARECRARALEADGQLFDAGEAYFESGFAVPDGLRCLWHSGRKGWSRLCDHLQQNPQIQGQIEFQLKLPGRTHCPASRPGRSGACRRFGGRRARVVCAVTKPGSVGIQGAGDRLTGCLDAHPAGFRRAPTGLVAT